MKAKELREMTNDELDEKLRRVREEQFHLRMQRATARLEKPTRLRDLRRDVARIETILHERKRGAA
jgi:large subunit ribosomal protein L29